MIQDLSEDRGFVELAEAKRQGHKFMKIYLHRSKIPRQQSKFIISGAVTLIGVKTGLDEYGGEQYHFEERRGDSMVFEFDRSEREFICYLYDDPGHGYFSPSGYNRDLLATHFNQSYFVIKDPNLYADVKLRYEYIQKNPPKKIVVNHHQGVVPNLNSGSTVTEINNQIEFLQQRKEQLIEMDSQIINEDETREQAYEKMKAERELGNEEPEKLAFEPPVDPVKTKELSKKDPKKKDKIEVLETVG